MNRALLLPLCAAASFSFATWHVVSSTKSMTQTEPLTPPVQTPYADVLAGVGLVEPCSENIKVAAVVPGTIVEVAARVGVEVAAGDVLFRLDDRHQQAESAVQEARLAEAVAALSRLEQMPRSEDIPPSAARIERFQADLGLRNDQLQRARQLVQQKAITDQELVEREQALFATQADLNQAEAEHARLEAGAWEADLAVARAQVELSQQLVEQARVELARLVVRAPIGGTILKVDVRPSEYVGTPPDRPLVILGDVQTLHVRVDIDEHELARFRPGMPGRGFLRGDATTVRPLRFVRVEPFAEPKRSLTGAGNERIDTRVLQVIYALEDSTQAQYVGQQMDVFLDVARPSWPGTNPGQDGRATGIPGQDGRATFFGQALGPSLERR